jgi:hypothetical protein
MNTELKEKIEKSPMFQLSLGSKELFHTNFLYWLWKAEPNAFWIIMSKFGIKTDDKGSLVVKREWEHFDLSIVHETVKKKKGKDVKIVDNIVAVIENKVKSIPRIKQLDNYNKEIEKVNKDNECKKILLALIDPGFDHNKEGWSCFTYEKYRGFIEDCLTIIENDYDRCIIEDYYNMIDTLISFKDEWLREDFSSMKYMDIIEDSSVKDDEFFSVDDYIDLRINDLRHKIIFSKMFSSLEVNLKEHNPETEIETVTDIFEKNIPLTIGYGMTNATGLIEAKVKINADYLLGIQVQGNQYRHFIEFSNSSCVKEFIRKELQDKFGQNHKEEFDISNKKICSYKNSEGKKAFQYVYRRIRQDETVDDVVKNIVDDVEYLMKKYRVQNRN